jgi:hypothetical protein
MSMTSLTSVPAASPKPAEVVSALIQYIATDKSPYEPLGAPDRVSKEVKSSLWIIKPAKANHGIWLIDAIHRIDTQMKFPEKFELVLAAAPKGTDTRSLRSDLIDTLVMAAVVDTIGKDQHLLAVWEMMRANPRLAYEFNLNREKLSGIQSVVFHPGWISRKTPLDPLSGACFLVDAIFCSKVRSIDGPGSLPKITETEERFLKGIFIDDGSEQSRRILYANLQFLRKHHSSVLDEIALLYSRYLAHKAICGKSEGALDKHIAALLFEGRIEMFYPIFIRTLSPKNVEPWDAGRYESTLRNAEIVLTDVRNLIKSPRHDEMLAIAINNRLCVTRLDTTMIPGLEILFRWTARVSKNWPMIATALLSYKGKELELAKAQKANAGSTCRLAMTYLTEPNAIRSVTSVTGTALANVVVRDMYTLKLAGLALHNRKDRNQAIETLYKVTQDENLLAMMSDTALENSFGNDLGL